MSDLDLSVIFTHDRAYRLWNLLPRFYSDSEIFAILCNLIGNETGLLNEAIVSAFEQNFIRTSDWGLDTHEADYGVSIEPAATTQERQDKIVGKIRGYGTATVALIKSVTEAFTNGTVDVIEDFNGYAVTIRFSDIVGIPPNIVNLQALLREIVPAHLEITFTYLYVTWGMIAAQNMTWGEFGGLGLAWGEVPTHEPFIVP